MRTSWLSVLQAGCVVLLALGSARADDVKPPAGVVVMHGKVAPGGHVGKTTGQLVSVLRNHGFLVETPEMPWSPSHHYDVSYGEMLGQIDAAILHLRERGAVTIFVAGHSFGAASALGWCAAHNGAAAGIIALSPGHVPESGLMREDFAPSVARARQMVADGKGDQTGDFADMNQGQPMAVTTSARHYLDWFAPDGPANLHHNVAACGGLPVYWAISSAELGKPVDRPMYETLPANPANVFTVVPGKHAETADGAATSVAGWIESLR